MCGWIGSECLIPHLFAKAPLAAGAMEHEEHLAVAVEGSLAAAELDELMLGAPSFMNLVIAAFPAIGFVEGRRLTPSSSQRASVPGVSMWRVASKKARLKASISGCDAGAGGESEDKRKSEPRTREAHRNGTGG